MKKDTVTFLKTIVAIPLVLACATIAHAYAEPITYESTGIVPSDRVVAVFPSAGERTVTAIVPVSNGADQNLIAPDDKKQLVKVTPITTHTTPTPIPAASVVTPAPVVQPVVVQQTPTPMRKIIKPARRTRAS